MKNRTQLVIGAALLAGVATLLLLPQSKAGKSREEHVESKMPEQVAAEPEKKTRVTPEPEVLPEPQALFEAGATEEEDAPEPPVSRLKAMPWFRQNWSDTTMRLPPYRVLACRW